MFIENQPKSTLFEISSLAFETVFNTFIGLNLHELLSLQEYILIDQYEARIDVYTRKGDLWKITRIEGIDQHLFIPSIDVNLEFRNLYRDVLT